MQVIIQKDSNQGIVMMLPVEIFTLEHLLPRAGQPAHLGIQDARNLAVQLETVVHALEHAIETLAQVEAR